MSDNIPEIDLNLKHYIGERTDVMKNLKSQIRMYLRNPNISQADRAIYSAIYNAVTYYQTISDLSIQGESEHKTFLENSLNSFTEDFKYLSEKYNSPDPTVPKVIEFKGRIKSPASAMQKILNKVEEYVHDGRDLTRLNESLRDFIGVRIIINPPPEIVAMDEEAKKQMILDAKAKIRDGILPADSDLTILENMPYKKAQSDFCYKVFDDLLTRKGILRQLDGSSTPEDFRFIPVNTDHDPYKQKKLKERVFKEGFKFEPYDEGVYVPILRPSEVETYDDFFKDYRRWPKSKLYQRIHTCAEPNFAKDVPVENLPNYIIPSKSMSPAFEYQFSLKDEDDFAEYGKAAHRDYKDRSFHRLGIPLVILFDSEKDKMRTGRLDESMEKFYGYSFEQKFGIPYQEFLQKFDVSTRDKILADIIKVEYNPDIDDYDLVQGNVFLAVNTENPHFVQNLLASSSKEDLERFYEANHILDNTKSVSPLGRVTTRKPTIKIYSSKQDGRKYVKARVRPYPSQFSGNNVVYSNGESTYQLDIPSTIQTSVDIDSSTPLVNPVLSKKVSLKKNPKNSSSYPDGPDD